DVAPAEAGDHGVVGDGTADDEPEAGVAPAQPLDRPARAGAVGVGVDQERQQDPGGERRLAGLADLVGGLEARQIHQRHGIDDQVDDVAGGQPVHQVDRQQVALPAVRLAEEAGHRRPSSARGRDGITTPPARQMLPRSRFSGPKSKFAKGSNGTKIEKSTGCPVPSSDGYRDRWDRNGWLNLDTWRARLPK